MYAMLDSPPPPGRPLPLSSDDTLAGLDMTGLRRRRLAGVRRALARQDYAGILLYDPINIRYATGSRNMAVWTLHNAVRYCFIPTEGPVILFDFHNCEHLSAGLGTVDEVRPAIGWFYFGAGARGPEQAKRWAGEIADLVSRHGGGNRRLAVDRCDPMGSFALRDLALELGEGQELMELVRAIKLPDEMEPIRQSMAVCEAGMARMQEALRPGLSENELWSLLHETNIAEGGEWIETRLLTAGSRTNPWFQESSDRIIRPGELVAFDTDLIGPFGYCSDVSRTFFCGPGKPSQRQKDLYGLAYDQIQTNMALFRAGRSAVEIAEAAWKIPDRFLPYRYGSLAHGVGLCDEYPRISHSMDFARSGYDFVLEAGMTLCVESYIGEPGDTQGVKLEEQILITEGDPINLSTYPFEEQLLPSRWV
ncbi:MAG: Xaa-Pro peptidase family protein [Rhodospirillales bacterium]